ncbi:SpoIIE family protein phosphatase [Lentzea guizhouensis]|nr:SpoIIE family protein phosphatase [Lentzea guizhouensis]
MRQSAFLDGAPVGFAVFDRRMRVLYANTAFATVHDLPPYDHTGRTVDELLPPGHLAAVKPGIAEVLRTGTVHRDVETRVQADNTTKHLLLNRFPLCDNDDEVVAAVVTVQDLTRTHASAELEGLRLQAWWTDRLDRAQQAGGTGSWELDLRGGTVTWSANLCRIAGVSRSPENLQDVLDLVHDDDREVVRAHFEALRTNTPATEVEFRLCRPDGRMAVVASIGETVTDDTGSVVALRGMYVDRTARRAAEADARAAVVRANAVQSQLEDERRVVLRLQRAMLPPAMPQVAGVELAAGYQPADGVAGVGGDFYDAFTLPDGRLAVAVGDVVGHDLEAAVTMGRIRSAIRAYAVHDPLPDRVLGKLNRLVCLSDDLSMTTVFYGVYTPWNGSFRYANAGHPHPLLVRDGAARLMPHRHGVITGVSRDARYLSFETSLQPDDLLLCYTDGLVEHCDGGIDIDAGVEKLCRAVTSPHLPDRLGDLVPSVIRAVGPESGRDDICVLALRRTGAASTCHRARQWHDQGQDEVR